MAIFVLSLWLTMAIVIFITHGRQEYCLTKHLIIIFNTGFCITLILAAVTPCARRPGNGIDRGRYGGRLLQAGCVVVYVTYWTWSGTYLHKTLYNTFYLKFCKILLIHCASLICLLHEDVAQRECTATPLATNVFSTNY